MTASFDFAQYLGQVGYPAYEPDVDECDDFEADRDPDRERGGGGAAMSTTVKAATLTEGDVVVRVVDDPGYPGEHIFSGQITRVRRICAGFVTLDTAGGAMSLSDAANVQVRR